MDCSFSWLDLFYDLLIMIVLGLGGRLILFIHFVQSAETHCSFFFAIYDKALIDMVRKESLNFT